MELVVISGKGGTGKTSLVGSLAALADDKVLVDCDVDAADLHLLLAASINEEHDFASGSKASIDDTKCVACGLCIPYCRFDAITCEEEINSPYGTRFMIDHYACEGCGVCRHFCPTDAITFGPAISGRWYISTTDYGTLVHARLGIAEGNSGKLVSLLRKTAKAVAIEEGIQLVITDGPPGIGCPVIASLTGADYVLIVTEPSLSALHDMERTVRLIAGFSIPAGICINKYDINTELTEAIEKYAAGQNLPVLARIPFDPSVTKAQIDGVPFVTHTDNATSQCVRSLWRHLQAEWHEKKVGQGTLPMAPARRSTP